MFGSPLFGTKVGKNKGKSKRSGSRETGHEEAKK